MIKLIVSDLDGTLLNSKKEVAAEDNNALKKASQQNINICLASGRMDNEILKVLKMLNGNYHRISQNGAFICTKDGKELQSVTFDSAIARNIYQFRDPNMFITLVCTFDTNFIEKKNEYADHIERKMFFNIEENSNLLEEIGTTIIPSKITFFGNYKDLITLQQNVQKQYIHDVDSYISDENCLDIMPKNISKGNAVSILIKHLGIDKEEIACIGDSFNDLSMFNITPFSFAMSHCHPNLIKQANYIVDSINEAVTIILNKINKN